MSILCNFTCKICLRPEIFFFSWAEFRNSGRVLRELLSQAWTDYTYTHSHTYISVLDDLIGHTWAS